MRLESLSLREAPAATRTFYWGAIDLSAPGFVGPPRDVLTLALDDTSRVRYQSWKTLPGLVERFGDEDGDFPLEGQRLVHINDNTSMDVTVDEATQTPDAQFVLKQHMTGGQSELTERIEGSSVDGGWEVTYALEGTLRGSTIAAHAHGTLYPGAPNAEVSASGLAGTWSAPVELVAPGFSGPPVDHMTVVLDGQGKLRSFDFDRFVRHPTFGEGSEDLPLSGNVTQGVWTSAVDTAVEPTDEHFVLRYHATSSETFSDFVEGLEGERSARGLRVRYFIKGKLYGSQIDAHAAGTLVPAAL